MPSSDATSSCTFLGLDKVFDLRVDCQKELPLVGPHPGVRDPLAELRVFVDQPGLPQHVGRRVLQLKVGFKIRIFMHRFCFVINFIHIFIILRMRIDFGKVCLVSLFSEVSEVSSSNCWDF